MKKILINSLLLFVITILLAILSRLLTFPVLRIFLPIHTNSYSLFSFLKLCFTASILFSLFKREQNKYQKALIRSLLLLIFLSIFSIPILLHTIPFSYFYILLLFLSIFLSELLTSKIKKDSSKSKHFSIIIILILFYLFLYFTDKPLDTVFFLPLN